MSNEDKMKKMAATIVSMCLHYIAGGIESDLFIHNLEMQVEYLKDKAPLDYDSMIGRCEVCSCPIMDGDSLSDHAFCGFRCEKHSLSEEEKAKLVEQETCDHDYVTVDIGHGMDQCRKCGKMYEWRPGETEESRVEQHQKHCRHGPPYLIDHGGGGTIMCNSAGQEMHFIDFTGDKRALRDTDTEVHKLRQQVATLAAGVEAVRLLMDESTGVVGLHKNGDIAPWEELEEDGPFCEWLSKFNDAERVLKNG